MITERQVDCFHARLGEDGLSFSVWLSNYVDDALDETLEAWLDDSDKEVGIDNKFTLSAILEDCIDSYRMPAHGNAIDNEDKPIFDAMRAELIRMIEKIDRLKFVSP